MNKIEVSVLSLMVGAFLGGLFTIKLVDVEEKDLQNREYRKQIWDAAYKKGLEEQLENYKELLK